MPRVKIQLADNIKRVVTFDTDATVGATLGTNLLMPDGKIGTPASVLQWLGGALPSTPVSGSGGGGGVPIGSLLTTKGDLLTRDTQVQRLPIGSTGQALVVAAGLPAWGQVGVPGGGTGHASYNVGDMLYADTPDSLETLAAGDDTWILTMYGGFPVWAPPPVSSSQWTRGASFSAGNGVLSVPVNTVPIYIREDCTLTKLTVLTVGGPGSCVLDIWRTPYGTYPPAVGNSICGSGKPTISSGIKYKDTTFTGWASTSLLADDTLLVNLESASVFNLVSLELELTPL